MNLKKLQMNNFLKVIALALSLNLATVFAAPNSMNIIPSTEEDNYFVDLDMGLTAPVMGAKKSFAARVGGTIEGKAVGFSVVLYDWKQGTTSGIPIWIGRVQIHSLGKMSDDFVSGLSHYIK